MSELRKTAHYDATDRTFTFQTSQDVEPILDNAARERASEQRCEWNRKKADIPLTIYMEWHQEACAEHGRMVPIFGPIMTAMTERKLRDPNWKKLLCYDHAATSFRLGWQ